MEVAKYRSINDLPKETVAMIDTLMPALKRHQKYASKVAYFDPVGRNIKINELLHQLMATMYLHS